MRHWFKFTKLMHQFPVMEEPKTLNKNYFWIAAFTRFLHGTILKDPTKVCIVWVAVVWLRKQETVVSRESTAMVQVAVQILGHLKSIEKLTPGWECGEACSVLPGGGLQVTRGNQLPMNKSKRLTLSFIPATVQMFSSHKASEVPG